jgi:protein Tex
MDNPIQVDLGRIAQDLQIRRVQVESVVQLLDEGNTVPFITRYRKERTGNLNEVVIREIQLRVQRLRELAERKETILKAIEKQEKLTPELAAAIRAAESLKRLEDLYLPYKPKKRTKASEAREKGLEPLALRIWNRDETLTDLAAAAQEFVDAEKGLDSTEKVLEGVGHILAEAISEMASVRDAVRRAVWKTGKVVTTKGDVPEGQGLEYRDYFEYSEPLSQVPPHRVLAINRGDKEGPLKVKIEVPRPELESTFMGQLPLEAHPQAELFHAAAVDALDRLILPSMEREVRRDLTETAEKHAVDVFARNLRSLLLQPPIPKQVVLAIDPGLRSGCKLAVLDPNGNLLDQAIVYPHAPQGRRSEAKLLIKDLVGKHQVGVVAIGNGTACRETEELIAEIISEGVEFSQNPEARAAALQAAEAAAAAAPAEPAVAEHQAHPQADAPAAEPAAEQPPADSDPADVESLVVDLPPISGGAPDSAPSETTETPTEPASETANAPEPTTNHQAHPTEETAGAEAPAVEAALEAPPVESALEAPPVEAALEAPSTEGGEAQATETAKPAQESSRRGRGEGRSRGSRSKSSQSTPPPQTPPAPHAADALLAQLAYVIVNEAGASVYSASPIGREELPDFDATLRSAISIGRRLQDPLSELVKIEPQNIGVGLYQHDVSPKQLKESLDAVISSCVNFVGVDLNTASVPLLRYVSGLNQLTARRIADRRKEKGAFTTRDELIEVEGVGAATFTQSAGFLKIGDGPHPLDRTWVHPESYEAATRLLQTFGYAPEVVRDKQQLPELRAKLAEADVPQLSKDLEIGEFTLRDIIEALGRPERDPRDDLPKPIFKKGILKLEDLAAGMELKGTVLNVVDFGAFVDIGLKDSGLVHISQLANRYIKSPHDVVSVGDVVTVWVMSVDQDRKRVSLTMVKPGTERHRGAGGGGRRGGEGQPKEAGEGRRGRGPRPSGSALTSPPVGTPPAAAGEGGPRRFDRERPGGGPGRGEGRPQGGRPGGPGQARGGQRGGPQGGGRFGGGRQGAERTSTPTPRPSRPAPPPPPLSKDALTGSVPLRTFGQLKQLWEARGDEPEAPSASASEPGHTPPAESPKPGAAPAPESPASEPGAE